MSEQKYYDATIALVDAEVNQTVIEIAAGQMMTFPKVNQFHKAGLRGVLTVKADGDFLFWAYPDQSLRRWPEQDIPANPIKGQAEAWSWRIDRCDDRITVKPGFIPGVGGQYIEDQTEKVEIDVPPEFRELCETRGVTVEQALRGFIADVCGLQSYVITPREDGYSSNGSDERMYAEQWFERAYFCK